MLLYLIVKKRARIFPEAFFDTLLPLFCLKLCFENAFLASIIETGKLTSEVG